jgi:ribosomal protein S18 acetylase RimI-like enzyme
MAGDRAIVDSPCCITIRGLAQAYHSDKKMLAPSPTDLYTTLVSSVTCVCHQPESEQPMPVVYRPMLPHDEHAVLTLWADVFNIPYDDERARLLSDPQRHGTTFVAVDTDGTVLSTAHYRVHTRRDRDGKPRRVGELDPVATRPDAQRQGRATRLVELALAAMQQDRCDWSLLATSDAGRSLYTHFEYTAFPIFARTTRR